MRHHGCVCLLVLLSLAAFAAEKPNSSATHRDVSNQLPVSTSSSRARLEFEKARQDMEDLRETEALRELRAAVKADPGFAQAYIMIAHLSHDPQEQESARTHAQQLAPNVSAGERLLIRWLAGLQEDKHVQAIAAMNDLLMKYPNDERVAFLAGAFLVRQERYPQAIVVLERAVTLDPKYAAALNELGYAYAFGGDFEKGSAAMDRYVALEPDQPNPHDSYGEILRLAGKFDAALEQYRMSIKIDPTFGSELGVADTYAVMGREEEARDEYARAIVFVSSDSEKVIRIAIGAYLDSRRQSQAGGTRPPRSSQARARCRPESPRSRVASGIGHVRTRLQDFGKRTIGCTECARRRSPSITYSTGGRAGAYSPCRGYARRRGYWRQRARPVPFANWKEWRKPVVAALSNSATTPPPALF